MAMLTIRNLPDDIHRALKARAALHGRSTEAEVRDILAAVVKPDARLKMGDALAQLGQRFNLSNQDIEWLEQARDRQPATPMSFE